MGEEQKKVIQRIAKLPARTEARGATRAEAEACVALAHRLMLKHGLRPDDLAGPDEPCKLVLWRGTRRAAEANTEARNALVRIGSDLQRMVGQVFGPDVRIRQSRAPTGPFDEAAAIAGMIDSGQVQLHDALGVA